MLLMIPYKNCFTSNLSICIIFSLISTYYYLLYSDNIGTYYKIVIKYFNTIFKLQHGPQTSFNNIYYIFLSYLYSYLVICLFFKNYYLFNV